MDGNTTRWGTRYRAIVVGVSAGGLRALSELLPYLAADFPLPVLIVQHLSPGSGRILVESLQTQSAVAIKEAEEKEQVEPGNVYIAPANYHLLVERDETLSLSVGEKVNYSRPSIDVLFESAAYAWGAGVIAVVLTGASSDGAEGAALIKQSGGTVVVQDPATAEYPLMPKAAIGATDTDHIVTLEQIGGLFQQLAREIRKRKAKCLNE